MTETVTPVMVVDRMMEILAKPEAWTKNVWARDASGYSVGFNAPNASCFCVLAAKMRVCDQARADLKTRAVVGDELDQAARRRGYPTDVAFNDDPKTTHADIQTYLNDVRIHLEATCSL